MCFYVKNARFICTYVHSFFFISVSLGNFKKAIIRLFVYNTILKKNKSCKYVNLLTIQLCKTFQFSSIYL